MKSQKAKVKAEKANKLRNKMNVNQTHKLWQINILKCIFKRCIHLSQITAFTRILLQSESLSSKYAKLHTVAASNNIDHAPWSLYHCLFTPHIDGCYSSHTSHLWWIMHSTPRSPRGCQFATIPNYCCDRKSRAACAQSFALWQQATIEITRRDNSIIACSRHIYIVFFFTQIPFVVNHTYNATPPERLQHYPMPNVKQCNRQTTPSLWFTQCWHDV